MGAYQAAWPVCRDVAELVAGATERTPLADAPGKSGARLERVVIGGQRYILKHLDLADDWTLRASGCLPGAPLLLWERGVLGRLPGCLNQPIVGVARRRPRAGGRSGGCALLMRDVQQWLVPATGAPIGLDQHARFLRHMAALHATFWDCGSEVDVVPAMHRYLEGALVQFGWEKALSGYDSELAWWEARATAAAPLLG
jgi:hypothetical protein